jgi:hypothetical protein
MFSLSIQNLSRSFSRNIKIILTTTKLLTRLTQATEFKHRLQEIPARSISAPRRLPQLRKQHIEIIAGNDPYLTQPAW